MQRLTAGHQQLEPRARRKELDCGRRSRHGLLEVVQDEQHALIMKLPLAFGQQRPIGVVDITDVVGLLPHEAVMRPLSSANDAEEDFDPAGTERPTILPLPNLRERSV